MLCECVKYSWVYAAVLQYSTSKATEIQNGKIINFYPRLSHIRTLGCYFVTYFNRIAVFEAPYRWTSIKGEAHTQFVDAWISNESMKYIWAPPLTKFSNTALRRQQCNQNMWITLVFLHGIATHARDKLASSPARTKNGEVPGTHCLRMCLRCGDSRLFSDSSVSCDIRVQTRYSKLVRII